MRVSGNYEEEAKDSCASGANLGKKIYNHTLMYHMKSLTNLYSASWSHFEAGNGIRFCLVGIYATMSICI